ncbi:MAG: undecaprenyl/decaprenyl-phosphate alpha-N-acetylglucosaminyl 1-phosphate transferase [Parcubacteria group bacterium]|nr:undecaprenyl/decaprenyl-phosphate alpha-N-acetylglucosaminyl 1-phosphate transferase [Parcubacteria group bacterium]
MIYLLSFLSAAFLSWLLTVAVRRFALSTNITDNPDSPRKIHPHPTPLLGGLAIFAAFWLTLGALIFFTDALPARYIAPDFLWGIFVAGLLLMLGGFLDDRFVLAPRVQIVFPILAALAVVGSGIGIEFVGNPLGDGLWHLDQWQWEFGSIAGRGLTFVLAADVFTVVWLLGMMYTTKFLDGLDGLVSGITTTAAFILFALSLTDKTFQPDVALLAIVLAGACAGFLVWNIHPARIFLGEGGSVWAGFMLGMLAIISGGKVATALLIMGIPILDVGWVIARRLFFEKRSPALGDDKHLHFRLLSAGFSHRKAVLLLWGLSAFFGALSLFLQTEGKVYLLVVMLLVMIMLGLWVTRRSKSSASQSSRPS